MILILCIVGAWVLVTAIVTLLGVWIWEDDDPHPLFLYLWIVLWSPVLLAQRIAR